MAYTGSLVHALLRAEVEPLIDREAWDKTMAAEAEHIETLREIISDWNRTRAAPAMHRKLHEFATAYGVSAEPINDEGDYEHKDSAFAAMVIDESQAVLDKHGLL